MGTRFLKQNTYFLFIFFIFTDEKKKKISNSVLLIKEIILTLRKKS